MNIYVLTVIGIIVGYLFGSIPFALIIGKIFYKVDVRKYGSGNLGSTNVTRTLGFKAGIIVLILDLLKGGLIPFAMYHISAAILNSGNAILEEGAAGHLKYLSVIYCVTGFFAALGHCHPLFAKFKGGKGVACMCGFLLFMNYRLFLVGIIFFFIALLITKIVSVGSISAAIGVMIFQFIPWFNDYFLFKNNELSTRFSSFILTMTIFMLGILLIYRHIGNINRLIHGEEKKFHVEKVIGNKEKK